MTTYMVLRLRDYNYILSVSPSYQRLPLAGTDFGFPLGVQKVASMYADDTSISFVSNSISTINNVVSKDLESLKTWLEENRLSLNVAKTHCILIGSRNKIRALGQSNTTMPSIYIGNDKVSP